MTTTVAKSLADLEVVIQEGLPSFRSVGTALSEVRERQLYKPEYRSFVQYLKDRWDLAKSHAYRTMDAASIAETLDPGGDLWDTPGAIDEFAKEAGYLSAAEMRKALEQMSPEQIVEAQGKVSERARRLDRPSGPERLQTRWVTHLHMLHKLLPKLGYGDGAAKLIARLEEITSGH